MRLVLVGALLLSALLAAYWTTRKPDNLGRRSYEREMSFLPMDVVYTWVNGSDPRQVAALHEARRRHLGENVTESEVSQDSRYIDNEELRFSLRSLEKCAPWVRKVYLVTNGQVPHWLDVSHPKLVLVTHAEIFANQSHLPTFSSPSIEANLHRIPGLSQNFLYLNDDTMFGSPVWPSDFITPSQGQKVFLSWSVPNCNEGCPPNWIGDGYCDVQCNVSACDWDANDCVNATGGAFTANNAHWYQGGASMGGAAGNFGNAAQYCARGCPSSWIGDKYCDRACKVPECAMDAGDCGLEALVESVYGTAVPLGASIVEIPVGKSAFFLNLTDLVGLDSKITDGSHDMDEIVRTATISQQYKVMILTLHNNVTRVPVHVSIQWDNAAGAPHNATFQLLVGGHVAESGASTDDTSAATTTTSSSSAEPDTTTTSTTAPQTSRPSLVSSRHLMSVTREPQELPPSLRRQLRDAKAAQLHPMGSGQVLGSDDYPWAARNDNGGSRKLMDVYGDSLKYVNALYNRHFSNEARKVPAHMGHMLQLPVLQRLIATFGPQWDATSSHAFRASDDMQFAFSYFYFLINERNNMTLQHTLAELDVDHSGDLDRNEWRTLWLSFHDPPIDEGQCQSSWDSFSVNGTEKVTPDRIAANTEFAAKMMKAVNGRPRNPTELRETDDVGFVMIRNNDTSLMERLDGIRKKRHKHICLNDNLHHNDPDTPRVKKIVLDFYRSILPLRCAFELDPQPLRTEGLAVWTAVLLSTLALCFVVAFVARQRKRKLT